jgi:hypothetical protein
LLAEDVLENALFYWVGHEGLEPSANGLRERKACVKEPETARNRPDFRSGESPSNPLGRAWDNPGTIRGTTAVSTERDDTHGAIKTGEPVDPRIIMHFATELSTLVQAGDLEGARSVHAIIGRLLAGECPDKRSK